MNAEDPFSSCTESVRRCVSIARDNARQAGRECPTTLDIMRALLSQDGTVAQCALLNNDISLSMLDDSSLPSRVPEMSLNDLAARCKQEARSLNHSFPGTEHLLLAICSTSRSRAASLLKDVDGRDLRDAICQSVLEILGCSWKRWRARYPVPFG